MINDKDIQLAKMIVDYSIAVKKGDFVAINCPVEYALSLGIAIQNEVSKAGGIPLLRLSHEDVKLYGDHFDHYASEEMLQKDADFRLEQTKKIQCNVHICSETNSFGTREFSEGRRKLFGKVYKPVQSWRVNNSRWVLLNYPTPSAAQMAQMTTNEFIDFFYEVCLVDYKKMSENVKPLKALMEKTDKVRIVNPDTDLTFSIKDIPVIPCCGNFNIPDGECFTAPVKDSINGYIKYNCPTIYHNHSFDWIKLEFKDGKIVNFESANEAQTEHLKEILDTDHGSLYVGEFALGFNNAIKDPMKEILFDEKISGSLHMAIGQCYDDAPNGNNSAIHWDMIQIQREDWGGGEVYFDDVLIRKDGIFVLEELKSLNCE